jgi:hypothetical protein
MNGRIDFNTLENGTPFFLQDKITIDNRTTFENLKYTQQNTNLSNLFFSMTNVQIIQNGLRAGVYNYSNKKYIIDEQNADALNIIMRAVYLQNSKNQDYNLTEQIKELNKLVIDYCVPKLHGEVEGYINYKKDASSLAVPLDNPIVEYTDKTLELKKFF